MSEISLNKILLFVGSGILGFLALRYMLNPTVGYTEMQILKPESNDPTFKTQNEKENIGLKNTSSDGIVPPKQNLEKPTKEETFNENSTAPIPENKDSEVLNTGKVGTM